MATEGFEHVATDEIEKMWGLTSRQEHGIAHLHGCLIRFEDLPDLDEAVASVSTIERLPFQELDDDMLRSLGVIVAVHAAQGNLDKFSEIWHEYYPDPVEEEDVG